MLARGIRRVNVVATSVPRKRTVVGISVLSTERSVCVKPY